MAQVETEITRETGALALPDPWRGRLGVLGQLDHVRRAAAAIRTEVGLRVRRLYVDELPEVAARHGIAFDDLKVAVDLLATNKVIHYADSPNLPIAESDLSGCDLSRVRFAYEIDPSIIGGPIGGENGREDED